MSNSIAADLEAVDEPIGPDLGSLSYRQLVWRRFRKSKLAIAGAFVLAVFYFVALFAERLAHGRSGRRLHQHRAGIDPRHTVRLSGRLARCRNTAPDRAPLRLSGDTALDGARSIAAAHVVGHPGLLRHHDHPLASGLGRP